ncbi:hypothetical protein K493DRAFT_365597 [Basidiobolus meristosporus CBS 931.73]|uniref:RFX1-4/6/8-like BCD domain-containing protein n=1 Tax=Basidiobolus meristosporus CBS 931.73 TaxID=1314790 RepID=A0A1Y1ZB86_9FUNG|nr:hypothetical protein K493DRAFT_365597 [Basidiobolus meristosporus CBS 931.73]|eukprot:ORY07237.1 hypothetical protein K493DRAFT_365597 [Basidiobolus meristosporus CBS 931.73]
MAPIRRKNSQESSRSESSSNGDSWHPIDIDTRSDNGGSSDLVSTAMANFTTLYRTHCQVIYDLAERQNFAGISTVIKQFWQELGPPYRGIANHPEVIHNIGNDDTILYDVSAVVIVPGFLTPLPLTTLQAIQDFAKQYDEWVVVSLYGHSQQLCSKKLEVARTFTGILAKLCSLNHLSQSAASIVQNKDQTTQMVADWDSIDFESLRDQAAIICQCGKTDLVQIKPLINPLPSSGNRHKAIAAVICPVGSMGWLG